jgi:two-component system OmpR family response regulator
MKKILILDRYPSVRELLAEELAAEGNTVVPIGSPQSIWSLLPTFEPDLIIMDLFMNGKWQWNILREIKKQNPRLPVLIFTAGFPEGDRRLSQADGWVIKSSVFDELKRKINEISRGKAFNENEPKNLTPMDTKQLSP